MSRAKSGELVEWCSMQICFLSHGWMSFWYDRTTVFITTMTKSISFFAKHSTIFCTIGNSLAFYNPLMP